MKRIRNRYIFILDIVLCLTAYALASATALPIGNAAACFAGGLRLIAASALIYAFVLSLGGMYRIEWVYAGANEYIKLLLCVCASALLSVLTGLFLDTEVIYPKLNIASNLCAAAFVCGLRFFIRLLYRAHAANSGKHTGRKTLIIGAGRFSVLVLREISENKNLKYDVVGLIDDDPKKQKTHIYNSSVIGSSADIPRICREKQIEQIIFAIHSISVKDKSRILDICSETGVKVSIVPGVEASLDGKVKMSKMREIKIEDLLERAPIHLDNELIESEIRGKTVMVTGGGGSIGSELCRQIMKFSPKLLVILDIYENTTYELQNELEEKYSPDKLAVVIASVRDKKRLDEIFAEYRPNIVFHAAAHKHVPLMEFSPCEAVKNNIFGTYNTALSAIEHGVKRFVLISTDKAVNPTNVMGASKRMCEMIVQSLQTLGKTEFAAVRFGNVLGSNGSVIPRFRKQIASGGPVTVTHPEITRFFMTIPEAAQLVLQAGAYAKGGEIFVLDMGKPVKIYDLAKKMIHLSGFRTEDIEIKFTGLRPGEKLYEELLMNEEGLRRTAHSKIFIGSPLTVSLEELGEKLEKLKEAAVGDENTVRRIISEVVPTYRNPQSTQSAREVKQDEVCCIRS